MLLIGRASLLQKKHPYVATVILFAALAAIVCWLVQRELRQIALNRDLIIAIDKGNASTVKTLLQHKADPNTRVTRENPPRGFLQTLRSLFDRRPTNGMPVLLIAEDNDNESIQHMLKEYGADPDASLRWHLTNFFPQDNEAISNGIRLQRL